MSNTSQIEALLFVAGDEGLTLAEIAQITGFDQAALPPLLEELTQQYQNSDSALMVRQDKRRYSLVTKPDFGPLLRRFFDLPVSDHLTQPQLETLVIIAYQQPITRVAIDQIRGVRSAGTIQKLLLHHLIEAVGRLDEVGRPILYGTTADFLDYFGLKDLEELPELPDIEQADLDQEELAEADLFGNRDEEAVKTEEDE
ncbi:SMC-Scp complex subunit ScpB [Eupransor demetentiae]|uniref:Segregation and condensation protein B n=1 Tax=Eupransor demetentiae TaxID=3109584 RepID=A0ABP0EP02_9LACO|nr:Chromosome segregation and condensation protein ScpB (ScpB) [Lactobacillaceae bacterium LMG 33000]